MARRRIDLENDKVVAQHNALVNQPVSQSLQQKVSRDIIDERLSNKNSAMIDMIGMLTPVTWFHQVVSGPNTQYSMNTSANSDIAFESKKYDVYNNFQVKFDSKIENSDEGDSETVRSRITEGTLIVLPRSIKPFENDIICFVYLDKFNIYRITNVEPLSMESDQSFRCSFTLFMSDKFLTEKDFKESISIVNEYIFKPELVGTTYRPILTYKEDEFITNMRELYNTIGKIYIDNCYDTTLNTFFLRYYGSETNTLTHLKPQDFENPIDGSIVRPINELYYPKQFSSYYGQDPRVKYVEYYPINMYDNLMTYFIKTNRIFYEVEGQIYVPDLLLTIEEGVYMRSIFTAIEKRDPRRFVNKYTDSSKISVKHPGTSALLLGKYIISHFEGSTGTSVQLIPEVLKDLITNPPDSIIVPFREKQYDNYTALISEIIARHVLRISSDLEEPLNTLHENMCYLFSDSVKPENIYYLYPMLGYVIMKTLEEKFSEKV